ncbi:SWI/SNF-related matrix-associated actin-dependent regulator of chromatin subfamily A containing [Scomber scombrus]|uniref:DNA helicase n=1 Tax=Scomber scombrus TaxID=13677 RepID=A0AAV1MUC0_SCOSC
MSMFNLDRFRFDKAATTTNKQEESGSKSPESEKENKPAQMKPVKGTPKSHARGVVFEEVITIDLEEDEPKTKISLTRKSKDPVAKSSKNVVTDHTDDEDNELEEKVNRLQEMFPQMKRKELLEVIRSTSTLEGAVAACLLQFGDQEDQSRKRKADGSSSSQDSEKIQPSKKRRPSVNTNSDEEEDDGEEPSWEKQEVMVRRLQKKFPDQDKEELRMVLQEHDWNVEDALQVLQMFSDPGLNTAILSSSSFVKKTTTSSSQKPSSSSSSSSSTAQMLSKFASGTSIAKKEAAERKRKARASDEHVSSEGENDDEEETVSDSEFEDSDEELDSKGGMTEMKKEILTFFQEASIDELSLISGCSVKKAQKIVELRPYNEWQSLIDILIKEYGLSEDLLLGCRVVLRERKVVLGLMSKCETISSKMIKKVTEVMKKGTGATEQPCVLNSQNQLKPYQMIGLKWLLLLHDQNLSGILADEMGLGKTIQAIAFLAQLYEDGIDGPHLITVPSSTLDNWVRELKLWCPSLKVLVYYGSVEDRRYLKHDILNNEVEFNVIVTTYNLAIGNDSDRSLFRKLRLKYAVFDEGHMLKNMNSLRYRHLMAINAEHRLLLTGTPLQNNLLELMSLLNFIMPSMFSNSATQLSKMFSMKSHEEQSRFERDRISQARLIMKPFILRRVKSEVLKQLPAKEEKTEFCSMSEKQQVLYQKLLKKLKASTNGEKRELCNVMMQLRKMANHPLLHRQYYTTEKLKAMSKLMLKEPTHFDADAALIQEDMEVMSDFELHRLCQQYSSIGSYQLENNLLLDSGKFHHLTELLTSLKDKGDRVVLFSQFTMMLDIVEILLRHLKHRYVRLDGSTPIADRIVLIDEFNTDPDIFVFLLSTRAGGLGINLTSANVVILHDIDCNPYNDKQAEDRCHRVGQTRTVQVIKLISKDSIEDCILQLGQKKLKLEQDMTTAEQGGEGNIPEDMASLLRASLGM